jgi:hypothetical protein
MQYIAYVVISLGHFFFDMGSIAHIPIVQNFTDSSLKFFSRDAFRETWISAYLSFVNKEN